MRLRQEQSYLGENCWRWSVWLEAADPDLQKIMAVTYVLDPTFANPVRKVIDRATAFRISEEASSDFSLYARISLSSGEEILVETEINFYPPDREPSPTSPRDVTKSKPVVLSVEDDPDVLHAIVRDLRQHYGHTYRILAAQSGPEGLTALTELKSRGVDVALIIADQRMPEKTGIEFLESTILLYPAARRALLTAYLDSDAVIKGINSVRLDAYLLKPWDPPEANLYPILDKLLREWFMGIERVPLAVRRSATSRMLDRGMQTPASYEEQWFVPPNQRPLRTDED